MIHPRPSAFLATACFGALASTFFVSAASAQHDCVFPPSPRPVVVIQPDGSEVSLRLKGGASARWYEDGMGFPVVKTADGYVYARLDTAGELVPTAWPAGRGDPAALGLVPRVVPAPRTGPGPGLAARKASGLVSGAVPAGGGSIALGAGSVKNLVILVRFSNHGPAGQNRTLPSAANVATIMNAVGGDPALAPSGSVRDHYLETSYGQFTIDSTVAGWINAPNTETYYANGNSGLTSRTWELITAGLNGADASVDFSQYDEDGDGWVDSITFLHSGYGAEWGGVDQYGTDYVDRMWSHKWSIPTWTSAEGVKVSSYNISPGLWATSGSAPGRIGVVCHELGHFFGLPDLYDTDGSSEGAGNWCLMAGGSWGFDGSQHYPSHMSPWAKAKLGWISPQLILPGAHVAPQVEFNPTVFRIDSGYPPGEYLLVENRQKVGFDLQIPQGGLAIWHVDESQGSLSQNSPNNEEGFPGQGGWPGNDLHYRNALLQADGFYNMEQNQGRGDGGDVYRSGGVAALNSGTTPNTNAYQGGTIVTSENSIGGIGASSANMAFTFASPSSPAVTTASAPAGTIGTPYSLSLASSGGSAPRTWSEYRTNPSYTLTNLGPAAFTLGGTALNLNADDAVTSQVLPFDFPCWERAYSRIHISTNGFIDLAPTDAEYFNWAGYLRANLRIAPMWDDLRTDLGGDVFMDTGTPGQVRIRWSGVTFDGSNPCNFAVRLFADGRIDFEYGSGNTGLTASVGISRGHSGGLLLAPTHDGQASLTNANRLRFTLQGSQIPPGLALTTGGVLSGTPTSAGSFQPIFRVTDSLYRYDQKLLATTIGTGCEVTATPISSATVCAASTTQFCTTAGGNGPFTYSWTKNGVTVGGATSSCYTATAGTGGTVDTYCVTVTGACAPAVQRCATLTANAVTAATPLTPATAPSGATHAFCTSASGTAPFTYSWTRNGVTIAGATSSCYTATAGAGGALDTYCVTVHGSCGSDVTRCATLGTETGSSFCFGDGLGPTACPCSNYGDPGRGCENSGVTGGALLTATGTTSPDSVVLTVVGEKPVALTIFLQGTQAISPVVYGDGLRCVHGVLKRLYVKDAVAGQSSAPAGAELSITARSAQLFDPIAPGQLRYYMTYYRDGVPTFCPSPTGSTFNGSNALSIQW
ncbi:MAG: M6 family metalloprotease domain-containing protein [Planctomycetota bacterium]